MELANNSTDQILWAGTNQLLGHDYIILGQNIKHIQSFQFPLLTGEVSLDNTGTFLIQHLHLISEDLIRIDKSISTHIDFTQDDINNAPDDDDEVKDVPGVSKVALHKEVKRCCNSWILE